MSRSDLYRIARAFVDGFIASYEKPPKAIILDIDDTQDTGLTYLPVNPDGKGGYF